jgi:hypothetical protein
MKLKQRFSHDFNERLGPCVCEWPHSTTFARGKNNGVLHAVLYQAA